MASPRKLAEYSKPNYTTVSNLGVLSHLPYDKPQYLYTRNLFDVPLSTVIQHSPNVKHYIFGLK